LNKKATSVRKTKTNSDDKKKSNNFTFIVALLIASFFWLMIKLSNPYDVSYQFKVNYTNIPQQKILTNIIDTTVNIRIKAKGFVLLRLELMEDMENLNINLSQYNIGNSKRDIYYVNTSEIMETIGNYLNIPISQVDISTLRLEFVMEDLFEKTVKVKSNIIFQFAPQYNFYSDLTISPAEIKIYGAKNIVDTIEFISTENAELSNISLNIDEYVDLKNPNPDQIHLSVNKVKLEAVVEKFTESSVETQIDLSGTKYKIKAFPNSVKVYFIVAQKDFGNVRQNLFRVVPNLKNINLLKENKLQLELISKPEFVGNIRLQPSEVEFLIIK